MLYILFFVFFSTQRSSYVAAGEASGPRSVWSGLPVLRCGYWEGTGCQASPVWSWESWDQQGETLTRIVQLFSFSQRHDAWLSCAFLFFRSLFSTIVYGMLPLVTASAIKTLFALLTLHVHVDVFASFGCTLKFSCFCQEIAPFPPYFYNITHEW